MQIIFGNITPGEEVVHIENLTASQYQALTWLADEDELALNFQNENPVFVIQRYALAAIYHATSGWPPASCLPFMSKLDHCEWNVPPGDECYINSDFEPYDWYFDSTSNTIGVSCSDNGYVTSLFLGKLAPLPHHRSIKFSQHLHLSWN
jgi:hypothetical protein